MSNNAMKEIEYRIKPNEFGWWVGELYKDDELVIKGTGCSTALGAFDELHHLALSRYGLGAIAHN